MPTNLEVASTREEQQERESHEHVSVFYVGAVNFQDGTWNVRKFT